MSSSDKFDQLFEALSVDDLDLTVLMDMIKRYSNFVARERDGKQHAAQFLDRVAAACSKLADEYRNGNQN